MGKLFALSLLFTISFCNGQVVRFQMIRVTPCDTIGKVDSSFYYLVDDKDSIYENWSGIVIVPKIGKYEIRSRWEPDTDFPAIDINKEGLFIYTFYEPKIVMRSYGMHPTYVYEICGKAIDGFQEDFFLNGSPRIRGNFVKGKPKDSLVTFYPNGAAKKRVTYLAKEIFIEEYDSLSNLVKVSHNSNKSYYLTDYKTTEYYPNGMIRLKESSVDRVVQFHEYYPNGQVKTVQARKWRREYHENGIRSIFYTWKRKKQMVIRGKYNFDYTIRKKIFDAAGSLSEVQIYEHWGVYDLQPGLEFRLSDWIIKWIKWENGKKIVFVQDEDSDKYFKRDPE